MERSMPIVPGAYWDLLERHTPPVKRRTTHAKARTGCVTCKRRRVKCDEAKPSCGRCTKSGHRCAGYEDCSTVSRASSSSSRHPDNKSTTTPPHLPLRPKPKPLPVVVVPGCNPWGSREYRSRRVDLLPASLTPAYLDIRDTLYFERFKCQIIADLGVWCGAEYWRHTILREVLTDKTVQHAALASAAMLMDIEQQQTQYDHPRLQRVSNNKSPPSSKAGAGVGAGEPTGKERAAFEEQPSEEAAGTRNNTREEARPVAPLSNARAHGKAALGHYTAALGRCRQTLAASGVTSSTARSSLTATFFFAVFELVQGNVREASQILSNGVSLLDHALSQTNPDGAPALVPDDELRQIQLGFDRMRVTWGLCPYFGSDRDAPPHASTQTETQTIPGPHVPVRHFELPSPDASMRTKQIFWNAFSSEFGQFMVRVQERRRGANSIRDDDLPDILAQRTRYLTQLRHWHPILADLCAQHPGSTLLHTTKAYAQTAIIFLNCFLDPTGLAYDAYLPLFSDIVATYQRLLSSAQQQQQQQGYLRLTLDVDLFHIITFTVSKCRDRATRSLALDVFAEMTRHQALWTNAGMLAALRALADLEDKGRDADGFVPPSSRYDYVNSEWDFEKRQMMAVFVPVLSVDALPTIRVPIRF
ncbi:hypothetical protein F4859DRAFT_31609 [Xylaria cf. heliscus]|nr:hypothetical protein F4859DRAFT_31609 [Xylaria cf. heliscus]